MTVLQVELSLYPNLEDIREDSRGAQKFYDLRTGSTGE